MRVEPSDPERRPVVGLVGYFGFGNFGDELFLDVFQEYLGDVFDLTVLFDTLEKPYFSATAAAAVDRVDAVLIGGGDLLTRWRYSLLYWRRDYLAKPVFVAGVGVPTWRDAVPQVVERYRAFFQHPSIRFVHARDPLSARWITEELQPQVEVREAPDLVCALTLPEPTRPAGRSFGVVTRHRSDLVDDYSHLEELVRGVQSDGYHVRHLVLGRGQVGERDRADARRLQVPGVELVSSDDTGELCAAIGGLDGLASMKFHGTVVATLYGVPSLVLVPTTKNIAFMERVGRTDLLAQFQDPGLAGRVSSGLPAPPDPVQVALLRTRTVALMRDLRRALADELGVALPERRRRWGLLPRRG